MSSQIHLREGIITKIRLLHLKNNEMNVGGLLGAGLSPVFIVKSDPVCFCYMFCVARFIWVS